MNSYRKLINNSAIFAIGRLGSKMISFVLLPLYTYFLTTAEYGTSDLINTTTTLMLPLVAMSMYDAVLRFIIDNKKSREVVLTNAMFVATIGMLVSLLFLPFFIYFEVLGSAFNVYIMYILLFLQLIERILSEYTRAIGKVKVFAMNGILLTFSTGILNILTLAYLKLGFNGYMLSIVLSYIISIFYLLITTKALSNVKIKLISKAKAKELLNYSIPLIPNSVMWWFINASSRYFIKFFLGISVNGLFALASKIPSLINIVNDIFIQAWQLSAIEEFDNSKNEDFYSNVFKYLSLFLFLGVSLLLVILKPTFFYLFSTEYYISWKVVPFLLLGTVFSSFSGFLGTNYIAAKQTQGVLRTSIVGGIISLSLNFILISTLGLIGAGLSSMISFFAMWILRYYDTKQFVNINIDWKFIGATLIIIISQIILMWFDLTFFLESSLLMILFLVLMVINRESIMVLFKTLVKK